MKLKGVIFDLDGTLADTIPVCVAACREAIQQYTGRCMSDEEIVALFGPSEVGIISRLVPDRWEECLATYMSLYEKAHERCRAVFPGVDTILELLQRRAVRLGIVTGKGKESAAISLKYLGLANHFDAIETGSPEGDIKAPSIQKILAKWRAEPERVAYVGDSPSDVKAAKVAGVMALGAAWAATSNFDQLNGAAPFAIFPTTESFADWIQENIERNR